MTEQVGKDHLPQNEPAERRELRNIEQQFPNEILFPLVERASLTDNGGRFLTFAEFERLRGIRVDSLPNPNTPAGLDAIASFAPDLMLTIRYGAILKPQAITIPRLGVLNLHSGILPAYRGVLATFRALSNGDAKIGCTLHYIRDATIDTGGIVDICRIPVDPQRSLLWHILALYTPGIDMVRAAVDRLAKEIPLSGTAQSPTDGRYFSYPTAEEWVAFKEKGWRIARPEDLVEILQRYSP